MIKNQLYLPKPHGLYHPNNEKENCGVGFIANIKSKASYKITEDALEMLSRMGHRGACGCEANTGDGAGILTNIPHEFFVQEIQSLFGVSVKAGHYGVGNIFLPQDDKERQHCISIVEKVVNNEGQTLIGWRNVPVDSIKADVGDTARNSQPVIKQLIIGSAEDIDNDAFEGALYIIKKHISKVIRTDESLSQALLFYVCSLSTRVIIYKGMLMGSQLLDFYPDLTNKEFKTYLAMVHSRFSTNTFPSWDRAQPCRFMAHNGEINTLQGNYNWMRAREGVLESDFFGDNLHKTLPVTLLWKFGQTKHGMNCISFLSTGQSTNSCFILFSIFGLTPLIFNFPFSSIKPDSFSSSFTSFESICLFSTLFISTSYLNSSSFDIGNLQILSHLILTVCDLSFSVKLNIV